MELKWYLSVDGETVRRTDKLAKLWKLQLIFCPLQATNSWHDSRMNETEATISGIWTNSHRWYHLKPVCTVATVRWSHSVKFPHSSEQSSAVNVSAGFYDFIVVKVWLTPAWTGGSWVLATTVCFCSMCACVFGTNTIIMRMKVRI